MKHLIFYPGVTDGGGERLKKAIHAAAPMEKTEICHTIHSLAYKLLPLRTISDSGSMAPVLVATCETDLLDLHSIRDLLSDLKIILIIYSRAPAVVAKAHELFPRYLAYLDEDFSEVAQVFAKMVKNNNGPPSVSSIRQTVGLSPG